MNEIIIEITDVSPRDFFGQNNETVALLKEHFPKLKIIARGSKIKAYGSESELNDFEQKLDKNVQLKTVFNQKNEVNHRINGFQKNFSGNQIKNLYISPVC